MNGLDFYLGYLMGSCYEKAQRKDPDPEPDPFVIGIVFAIIIFPIIVFLCYNLLPRIISTIIAVILILSIGFLISKIIYRKFLLKIIISEFWEIFLILFCCILVLVFLAPDIYYSIEFALLSAIAIGLGLLFHDIQHQKELENYQKVKILK